MNATRYLAALLSAAMLTACTAGDGPLDPLSGATSDLLHQRSLATNDGDQSPIPLPPIEDSRVKLTTDQQSYAPGGSVWLTLGNGSDEDGTGEALGVNLCLSVLERRQDDRSWVRSHQQSDANCLDILQVVGPGQSISESITLSPDLEPGAYRFSTNVEGMETGASSVHSSNSFRVEY